jgi:hypothetical protein
MESGLVKMDFMNYLDPKEPLDILFVGSTGKYKDKAVSHLSGKGMRVCNVSESWVDLYPDGGQPITLPDGCYFSKRLFDEDVYFKGQRIDLAHHLAMFFKKLKEGRVFDAVCSTLASDFGREFSPSRPPLNFALIERYESQFDQLPEFADMKFSHLVAQIFREDGGFRIHPVSGKRTNGQ